MPVHIEKLDGIAFLAFPDTLDFLKTELSERFSLSFLSGTNSKTFGEILYIENTSEKRADLFLSEQPYWARTTLLEPFLLYFESIGDAAKALKEIQRNWAPYQYQSFRRAALIQEKLPYINLKAKNFPVEIPKSPIGVYTLIDDKTILASAKTSSFLPAGKIEFVEDHENPPSRAYLKIQESLTLARHFFGVPLPGPDSRCFEAGACPGGWT
ncbi:MAG: SAM-dependent methyltransferase, partial [Treponema sp.]|nr:SAM-dependent methyltransferase [Treponema sp.]